MTLKEKVLIAIIGGLLIYGLFSFDPAKAQDFDIIKGKDNQIAFMENAMQTGAQLDPVPYISFINMTLMTQDPKMIKHLALKFAHCHILWQNAIQNELYTEFVGQEEYAVSAARALQTTQLFVFLGGGDPRSVEPVLIPGLIKVGVVVDAGAVAECVAIDGATIIIFEESETPETDWTKPEKEPKEPSFSS